MALSEYKKGDDVIEHVNFQNERGANILLASMVGYGIEIFDPTGVSKGKYGLNAPGYTADTDTFYIYGDSDCLLKLPQTIYGDVRGIYKAELFITYTDANFPDTTRDLHSNKLPIFKII